MHHHIVKPGMYSNPFYVHLVQSVQCHLKLAISYQPRHYIMPAVVREREPPLMEQLVEDLAAKGVTGMHSKDL